MTLREFFGGFESFSSWGHNDKIKLFAWYLQTQAGKERFTAGEIKQCYEELGMEKPANFNTSLVRLRQKSPPQILRDKGGYYLERRVRDELDAKYSMRPTTHQIHALLHALPGKLPDVAERQFLDEAMICLKHDAPRAAIVMTWNLAYDHLCNFVFTRHLAAFNASLLVKFPKSKAISKRDDFGDLKEFDVLEMARTASIISSDLTRILKEKLGKRNTAAHPNAIVVTLVEAEAFVSELVNNVVLIQI